MTSSYRSPVYNFHYYYSSLLRQMAAHTYHIQLAVQSRVCTVAHYAVLEAIRVVYGLW